MKLLLTIFISFLLLYCNESQSTTSDDSIRLLLLSQQRNLTEESTSTDPNAPKPRLTVGTVLKDANQQPVRGAKMSYNASGLSTNLKLIGNRNSEDTITVTTSSTGRYSLTLTEGTSNIKVESSTGEDLGGLVFEVKDVNQAPSASSEGDKLAAPENLQTKKAPSVNLPLPESISFTDTAIGTGKIGGLVKIKKALDESNITLYFLYWADELNYKLTEIARFSKTGSDILYTLKEVNIPEGASKLLVVSVNDEGEMDAGASLVIEDK